MEAQRIYDTVVLPYLGACAVAGISMHTAAALAGVSRSAPYQWRKLRATPREDTQIRLRELTEKIVAATEKGILPLPNNLVTRIELALNTKQYSSTLPVNFN